MTTHARRLRRGFESGPEIDPSRSQRSALTRHFVCSGDSDNAPLAESVAIRPCGISSGVWTVVQIPGSCYDSPLPSRHDLMAWGLPRELDPQFVCCIEDEQILSCVGIFLCESNRNYGLTEWEM